LANIAANSLFTSDEMFKRTLNAIRHVDKLVGRANNIYLNDIGGNIGGGVQAIGFDNFFSPLPVKYELESAKSLTAPETALSETSR
jgi:hypothetical protein